MERFDPRNRGAESRIAVLSMAAKAFIEAMVNKRICRKTKEKQPRTINKAVNGR